MKPIEFVGHAGFTGPDLLDPTDEVDQHSSVDHFPPRPVAASLGRIDFKLLDAVMFAGGSAYYLEPVCHPSINRLIIVQSEIPA